MPIVDATLDALEALKRQVPVSRWNPQSVRRRALPGGQQELVLVDLKTGKVKPRTPRVYFRPTATDSIRVAELSQSSHP